MSEILNNLYHETKELFNALESPMSDFDFDDFFKSFDSAEHKLNDFIVQVLISIGEHLDELGHDKSLELLKDKHLNHEIDTTFLNHIINITHDAGKKLLKIRKNVNLNHRMREPKKHSANLSLRKVTIDKIKEIATQAKNLENVFRAIPHAASFIIDIEGEFKTLTMKENHISDELFKASINEIETMLTNILIKILVFDQEHLKFFLPKKQGAIKPFPLEVIKIKGSIECKIAETQEVGRVFDFPAVIFDILLNPVVSVYDDIDNSPQMYDIQTGNLQKSLFIRKIKQISRLYSLASISSQVMNKQKLRATN